MRLRRGLDRDRVARQTARIAELCLVNELELRDWPLMLELLVAHPRLDARDAVYAATALNRGLEVVVSPDRDFDDVAGLRRADPADGETITRLRR